MSVPDQENYPSAADHTHRLCDFCNESKALLYCRADSAKLCFNCDREVHSTNQLFKKHSRCLLCDSCNSSPSSIFCCTESTVLCQNCDWETHKHFGSTHDRRPLEGFSGCPSVSELMNFLGFDELGKKNSVIGGENDDDLFDYFVWETPSVVSLDDLIVSNDGVDSGHNFQAMGVPPLPKNRNATCGKHKEEVLSQLREMAKSEPDFDGSSEDFKLHVHYQSQVPGEDQPRDGSRGPKSNVEQTSVPSFETGAMKWCDYAGGVRDEGFSSDYVGSFIDMNHLVPDKDSDIGDSSGIANGFGLQEAHSCDHMDMKACQVPLKPEPRELNSQERDSAITRYKEKRKTRRYDKHIRYESRKVRAESRTRIKGRFAKMDH